jgi:hypothetical protein
MPGWHRASCKRKDIQMFQYSTANSRNSKRNGIPIYAQGKIIGLVVGDVFRKRIRGSIHALRKPPALALDIEALRNAESVGARWVAILDIETNKTYWARISIFWDKGKVIDRGYGVQMMLCFGDFTVSDTKPRSVPASQIAFAFDQTISRNG